MKNIMMVALFAALPAFADYTLKIAPQSLADWKSKDSYVEGSVPGAGAVVILPADMNAKVDDGSIAFVSTFAQIKPTNRQTSVLTVTVASEATLGCAFYSAEKVDARDASTRGLLVKAGEGVLTLGNAANASAYFSDIDVQTGTLVFPAAGGLGGKHYGRVHVAEEALLIPGADTANWMTCLTGAGTVSNGIGTASNCRLLPGYGDGVPAEFSGKILDKIMLYQHGWQYYTGTESTFSGGVHMQLNSASENQGIIGARKLGNKGEPSSVGTDGSIALCEFGGRFLYLGDGETSDKGFAIAENNDGHAHPGVLDAGATGGLTISGNVELGLLAAIQRMWLTGSNVTECVLGGKICENIYAPNPPPTTHVYLTKKGSGRWRLANAENKGLAGIAVEEGTLAFDSLSNGLCSLGDGLISTVDAWVRSGETYEMVPYNLKLGSETTCGTLEYTGTELAFCTNRPLALAGDGCLANGVADAAKAAHARFIYNGGISSIAEGGHTLTLSGSSTNESVVTSVKDGAIGSVGIAKEGTGTWTLAGRENTFTGPIDVREGKLVLQGVCGQPFTWYRWTIRELRRQDSIDIYGKTPDPSIRLDKFGFWDEDGKNVCMDGMKEFSSVTKEMMLTELTYPMLKPNTMAFAHPLMTDLVVYGSGVRRFPNAFIDAAGGNNCYEMFLKDSQDQYVTIADKNNPSTWVSFIFRFPKSGKEICRYDLACIYRSGTFPKSWKMEGSVNGVDWYELDDQTAATWPCGSSASWWWSGNQVPYNNGDAATHEGGYSIPGSTNDVTVVYSNPVSVAAGAVLEAEGQVCLTSLSGDTGNGTIRGFSFGATGQIALEEKIQGSRTLPVRFENVSGLENVANWSVAVGGVIRSGYSATVADGKVTVHAPGLMVIFK